MFVQMHKIKKIKEEFLSAIKEAIKDTTYITEFYTLGKHYSTSKRTSVVFKANLEHLETIDEIIDYIIFEDIKKILKILRRKFPKNKVTFISTNNTENDNGTFNNYTLIVIDINYEDLVEKEED